MMYENDKLYIPEKYRKMSAHELQQEKERVLLEIKKQKNSIVKNKKREVAGIMFRF